MKDEGPSESVMDLSQDSSQSLESSPVVNPTTAQARAAHQVRRPSSFHIAALLNDIAEDSNASSASSSSSSSDGGSSSDSILGATPSGPEQGENRDATSISTNVSISFYILSGSVSCSFRTVFRLHNTRCYQNPRCG